MRSFTWKKRRPPLTWVSWDYFTHKSLALRAKVWELSNKDKSLVLSYMVFPVVMHGCESWTIKKAECQRIDASELWCWRTLESPLECKIQPVNPKGNQSWIFIGRTKVEAPILCPRDVKNWLTGKDPDAGKDWWEEEKGMTEDEMAGWHHRLNGHEFEQVLGDAEGQGSLTCCSPWDCK